MTSAEANRRIPIASAPNLRDLGHLPTENGVFKPGEVYRSASLTRLGGDDLTAFMNLRITTVYDLRTAGERESAPDHLPDGARTVWLDVLGDSTGDVAAGLGQIAADPGALTSILGDGKAVELMKESYRNIVSLPSALKAYRSFYLDLIDPSRTESALFHCTTGKDRTGWAAASLLLLLGAEEDVVRADYLETNTDLAPALRPVLEGAAAKGVDTSLILPILEVREEYLDTALSEARDRFGSIRAYAQDGLGLSSSQLAALQERFVQA